MLLLGIRLVNNLRDSFKEHYLSKIKKRECCYKKKWCVAVLGHLSVLICKILVYRFFSLVHF